MPGDGRCAFAWFFYLQIYRGNAVVSPGGVFSFLVVGVDIGLILNLVMLVQLALLLVADVLILVAGARAVRQLDELWRNYPQDTLSRFGVQEAVKDLEEEITKQTGLLTYLERRNG